MLTPIVRERYKIREQYLVPYRRWCISFSGMLHEFQELCEVIQDNDVDEPVTDTDMIVHVWAMHSEVEKGFKWLNVVKLENLDVGKKLDSLMDGVDVLWHELQDKHNDLLAKQATSDDLYIILNKMSLIQPAKKREIADEIMIAIVEHGEHKDDQNFNKEHFMVIAKLLRKKIPKAYLGLPYILMLKHAKQALEE
jgi:hypothetical protein